MAKKFWCSWAGFPDVSMQRYVAKVTCQRTWCMWSHDQFISPLELDRLTDRKTHPRMHTHTSAGVDVLRVGRLPDEVVLVEAGAVLGDHHRLCCTFGPGVNHFRHWVGVWATGNRRGGDKRKEGEVSTWTFQHECLESGKLVAGASLLVCLCERVLAAILTLFALGCKPKAIRLGLLACNVCVSMSLSVFWSKTTKPHLRVRGETPPSPVHHPTLVSSKQTRVRLTALCYVTLVIN